MLEYVEIRAAATREIIGIIDTAKSIIWHVEFYGAGDFEIYCPCNDLIVQMLVVGNYVTRPDDQNVGIIEAVDIDYNINDGRMIIATGRMVKSLFDRRVIYKISGFSVSPTILTGNVETAARSVITENAINCAFDSSRNIDVVVLGEHSGSTKTIVDSAGNAASKQVTYSNLLTWIDSFLQEYEIGALMKLNDSLKFEFVCFEGVDRSVNNSDGNEPVIFSQQFDNLYSSKYVYSESQYKNAALIGGEGEGIERFCSLVLPTQTGIDRRETFIDASATSKKYTDDEGVEHEISDSDYNLQLQLIGRQNLAQTEIMQTFDGGVDLSFGSYKYGVDFFVGDIITIQDNEISLYINTRILEITEVNDENGYSITAKFGK